MRIRHVLSVALIGLLLGPIALAQNPAEGAGEVTLGMSTTMEPGFHLITRGSSPGDHPNIATFRFAVEDESYERYVLDGVGVDRHLLLIEAFFTTPDARAHDWTMSPPTTQATETVAGDPPVTGLFDVYTGNLVDLVEVEGILRFSLSRNNAPGERLIIDQPWRVRLAPQPNVLMAVHGGDSVVAPFQRGILEVDITNTDFYPGFHRVWGTFQETTGVTPSEVPLSGGGTFYLQPGETRRVLMMYTAPREIFWYNDISTPITIYAQPVEGGALRIEAHTVVIDGFNLGPGFWILILAFIAQLLLLIWLIIFAKRAYDRTFLGRPIAPWKIPEEKANLERIRRDDPRAFYVLRYYLMEEEYRSALLWFYGYKKLSKKQLKAEARAYAIREQADEIVGDNKSVARFDRAHDRMQRRYARRIERRKLWIEKRVAAQQRKLERGFQKEFDKSHKKWEKKVEKLKAKADRPFLKEKKNWEKQTAKILAKWERPFAREKKKYDKRLDKAKERYEKLVKKVDKPAWKSWAKEHKAWEKEMKVRQKEGLEAVPEPDLLSKEAGDPGYPKPLKLPPKPELPPAPKPTHKLELPAEPQLTPPRLASHKRYARRAERKERKGWNKIHALEHDLGKQLEEIRIKRGASGSDAVKRREKLIEKSKAVAVQQSFVDKVLGRTPEKQALAHQRAYIRSITEGKLVDFRENERAHVDRVRLDGLRREAEAEAQIIRERATLTGLRGADEAALEAQEKRVERLETQLEELRVRNQDQLKQEQEASRKRVEAKAADLDEEEEALLQEQEAASRPKAAAGKTARA